jgi:hypothetical protein
MHWRGPTSVALALLLCAACVPQRCAAFSAAPVVLGAGRSRAPATAARVRGCRAAQAQAQTATRYGLPAALGQTTGAAAGSGERDGPAAAPAFGGLGGDIDPPLARLLLEAARAAVPGFDLEGVASAASGLRVWQAVLQRGRLPVETDFGDGGVVWPQDPLFSR